LIWECEIIEPAEYAGKIYKHLTPIEIGPKSKSFKFLLSIGVPAPKEGEVFDFNSDDYNGKEFVAQLTTVKIKKGQNAGKDRNEFKDVWSPQEFLDLQNKSAARANIVHNIVNKNTVLNAQPTAFEVIPNTASVTDSAVVQSEVTKVLKSVTQPATVNTNTLQRTSILQNTSGVTKPVTTNKSVTDFPD